MDGLKKLLGEDLFKQVSEKLGDNKVYLQSELGKDWIPKTEFNKESEKRQEAEKRIEDLNGQLGTQKSEFEKQIKETQSKIKELEPLAEANTELSERLKTVQAESEQKVTEFNEQLEKTKQESEKAIKEAQFNSKVRDKIRASGAMKDTQLNAVLANIDIEKVSDDDSLTGLGEQIDALKQDASWMFGEIKIDGNPPAKPEPPKGEISVDDIKNMSAQEIIDYGVDKVQAALQ